MPAHPSLLAACERGDFAQASRNLRWGDHADFDYCGPPALDGLRGLDWLRLDRVPLDPEERGSRFESTFAGLATGSPNLALLIGCDGTSEPGVSLGINRSTRMTEWIRKVSAPATLYEPLSAAPDCARHLRSEHAGGIVYRLTAAEQLVEATAAAPSLLHRLLVIGGTPWAVLFFARALGGAAIDEQLEAYEQCIDAASHHGTRSEKQDELVSLQVENPAAVRVTKWLGANYEYLRLGRSLGAWTVSTHVGTPSAETASVIVAAMANALPDAGAGAVRWVCDRWQCAESYPAPESLLTSRDLSRLLTPPPSSLGGLAVIEPPPLSRRFLHTDRALPLGTWLGVEDQAVLGVEDLEGHAFVAGVTGSGKSTTIARLLVSLWNEHHIPFLVIDPVKADYQEFAGIIDGGLTVLNARDLRLNVLAPWPEFDPVTHLGLVAAAFKGSFSMPSPVPYVVTQLFDQIGGRASWQPYPTLHDVRADVDRLVRSLGYGAELEGNIRASVGTRLAVLLAPSRAERTAAADSSQLIELIGRPLVIQLSDLGDDEERAFLMTLLTLYVAEAARARGRTPGVAHVTVLEEAHRIMAEPRGMATSEESGDPASVSAKLITLLLAEIRSYAESLIVIDQSPAAVARDAVRNTNLKLCHRIVDPDDRQTIAGSLGMDPDDSGVIARLNVGEALIASRRLTQPQLARIHSVPIKRPLGTPLAIARMRSRRPCCADGVDTQGHHLAEQGASDAEASFAMLLAAGVVGEAANWEAVRTQTELALARLRHRYLGAGEACLAYVGLRQALVSLTRLELLRGEELSNHLAYAFKQWREGKPMPVLTKRVAHLAKQADGPYEGCLTCSARCLLRHLGQTGGVGRGAGLRRVLERDVRNQRDAIAVWMREQSQRFAKPLGDKAGAAAALCIGVHAADAARVPAYYVADASLAFLEAMEAERKTADAREPQRR